MMAVILAGGKGTRLAPLTITIPKPLLPLGDRPILEVVIDQLAFAGVTKVVITLGHLAHLFQAVLGDGKRFGLEIIYSYEESPLGTAGPIKFIKNLSDNFIVINGDILTTLDFKKLYERHTKLDAIGTLAVNRRTVNIDYGVVRFGSDGSLDAYDEKPKIHYHVSMGVNVLSKKCLEFIPYNQKFDMPDLMMAMKSAGKTVHCYETDCYWRDIGRMDDFEDASRDFLENPKRFIPNSPGAS